MSLIRWSPFLEPMGEWDKMFDDFRKGMTSSFAPAMDMYEKDDHLVVEAQLPGIDPKNVEVSVENDVLTVHGRSEKKSEVEEKNYYRKEIHTGSFYRSVQLPAHVEGSKASAVYEDGVLKIAVPKKKQEAVKKVKVEVEVKKNSVAKKK